MRGGNGCFFTTLFDSEREGSITTEFGNEWKGMMTNQFGSEEEGTITTEFSKEGKRMITDQFGSEGEETTTTKFSNEGTITDQSSSIQEGLLHSSSVEGGLMRI